MSTKVIYLSLLLNLFVHAGEGDGPGNSGLPSFTCEVTIQEEIPVGISLDKKSGTRVIPEIGEVDEYEVVTAKELNSDANCEDLGQEESYTQIPNSDYRVTVYSCETVHRPVTFNVDVKKCMIETEEFCIVQPSSDPGGIFPLIDLSHDQGEHFILSQYTFTYNKKTKELQTSSRLAWTIFAGRSDFSTVDQIAELGLEASSKYFSNGLNLDTVSRSFSITSDEGEKFSSAEESFSVNGKIVCR